MDKMNNKNNEATIEIITKAASKLLEAGELLFDVNRSLSKVFLFQAKALLDDFDFSKLENTHKESKLSDEEKAKLDKAIEDLS